MSGVQVDEQSQRATFLLGFILPLGIRLRPNVLPPDRSTADFQGCKAIGFTHEPTYQHDLVTFWSLILGDKQAHKNE